MAAPSQSKAGTTEPFELQVSKGEVVGHIAYYKRGSKTGQDTTEDIIHSAGYTPAHQTAAGVVKVSSGDVDDTSAGTGARTVRITGLSATYAVITEVITMTGQTAVNTVNSYLRVTEIQPLTFGASGVSEGIIYAGTGTVTAGVPATVYLRCAAGAASTASLGTYQAFSVGVNLYVTGVNIEIDVSSNTGTSNLQYRALESATWITLHTFVTSVDASTYPQFSPPLKISAGQEYRVTSDASATTIAASANVYGIQISD